MKKITKAVAIAAITASATTAQAWWGPATMTDEQRQAIADQQAQYIEQVQQHQAQAQKAWEEAAKRSAELYTDAYQPIPAVPAPTIPAIGAYPQDIVALQQAMDEHHEEMLKQMPQPWQPVDVSDRFAPDPEQFLKEAAERREAALARFEALRNERLERPVPPRSAARTQVLEQREQEMLKRREEAKVRRDERRKTIEEQRAAAWQDRFAARDVVPSEL